MRSKKRALSNFANSVATMTPCYRPEKESQLELLFGNQSAAHFLARGQGLSYNDSCLLSHGFIIDTSRLNHFSSFDVQKGVLACQPGVTFKELLQLHPQYLPAVVPGTLLATVGGGIAHDIHGKNNPMAGSFGHQITWMDIQIGGKRYHCSPKEHQDLFFSTIGGLGLTGMIVQVGLKLLAQPPWIERRAQKFAHLPALLHAMETSTDAYQAAWVDLFNEPKAILFSGQFSKPSSQTLHKESSFFIPKGLPCLIRPWVVRAFNHVYYNCTREASAQVSFAHFNNPLDSIPYWQRLYGKRGLLQFQGVFNASVALEVLEKAYQLIHQHQAVASLCVLKYFQTKGVGLLSFAEPGFSLSIDFVHTKAAHKVIKALNQLMLTVGGKVYLAKDLFLSKHEFQTMYPQNQLFQEVLKRYKSPMRSLLSTRLGLTS